MLRRSISIFLALALLLVVGGEIFAFFQAKERIGSLIVETRLDSEARRVEAAARGIVTEKVFANPTSKTSIQAYQAFFLKIQSPQVIRVKAWDKDRTVLWSSLSEIIGQKFTDNDEVTKAFTAGHPVFGLEEEKDEQIFERQYAQLAEFYVPLLNEQSQVYGVLELYEPATVITEPVMFATWRVFSLPAVLTGLACMVYSALVISFLVRKEKL